MDNVQPLALSLPYNLKLCIPILTRQFYLDVQRNFNSNVPQNELVLLFNYVLSEFLISGAARRNC